MRVFEGGSYYRPESSRITAVCQFLLCCGAQQWLQYPMVGPCLRQRAKVQQPRTRERVFRPDLIVLPERSGGMKTSPTMRIHIETVASVVT